MFRRHVPVGFVLLLLGAVFFFSPDAVRADQPADAQSWVGTWTGTTSTQDSHNDKPTVAPYTVVITQADIGKSWTIHGNSISKDESVAGVKLSTTLTRTGPDTCTLVADGVGSGRGGFTRHVTGDLTRH